ncbi:MULTISPECIES: hypothetical protein [Glutamicibacter]|uniref:hypothetical protein n=1 Tax=Glutamicibacter TaxID=1742989 RepID=UPI00195C4EE1|nr:hypothetical protein [Glutamicibacter nicotianae]MBM7767034.1 hypothetical protein [Glutamicibacter nicotianae]
MDAEAAGGIVGSAEHREVGLDLQRKSAVLLQNKETADGGKVLPLKENSDVYILGDFTEETLASYIYGVTNGNTEDPAQRPSAEGSDYALISVSVNNKNTSSYKSDDPESGMNPERISSITMDGVEGLDGKSPFDADESTEDGLRFGGSLPWESSILDFSGMAVRVLGDRPLAGYHQAGHERGQ